jgi:hypothetical protein
LLSICDVQLILRHRQKQYTGQSFYVVIDLPCSVFAFPQNTGQKPGGRAEALAPREPHTDVDSFTQEVPRSMGNRAFHAPGLRHISWLS